jgi:DUF971 family protein
MPRPNEIVHHTKENRLTIVWDEGPESAFPISYLRGWCPCAECQGHGIIVRYQASGDLAIEEMREIGSYALGIRFSDGHDSGIYTWDWLWRIAPESVPLGFKAGTLARGQPKEPPTS